MSVEITLERHAENKLLLHAILSFMKDRLQSTIIELSIIIINPLKEKLIPNLRAY